MHILVKLFKICFIRYVLNKKKHFNTKLLLYQLSTRSNNQAVKIMHESSVMFLVFDDLGTALPQYCVTK